MHPTSPPQAGDIICFSGPSLLSRAIRWLQRSAGEPPSKASHVGIMVADGLLCEALSRVVVHPLVPRIQATVASGGLVSAWRPLGLDAHALSMVVAKALEYEGRRYGWWKLFPHALDNKLFRGKYVVRRLLRLPRYPICSWLAAYSFEEVRLNFFGVPPWAAQPDDILDFILAHCPGQFAAVCQWPTVRTENTDACAPRMG